jgi:transposase
MERNRLLKLLETANIKLASVASNVFGVSGMAMLRALIEGVQGPEEMAQLAKKSLRKKIAQLELALLGKVDAHHRFILRLQVKRLDAVEADIASIDAEIDQRLEPYRVEAEMLMEIPGVDRVIAATLIAELGTDMTVFPSEKHASAWAGVCPGNNESAGKTKRAAARKGNEYLKAALVRAAVCAARKRGSYFKSKYYRLKARCGAKRAAVAIAHKILVVVYNMLKTGVAYTDLGEAYLDRLDTQRSATRLLRRLTQLGYDIEIKTSHVGHPSPAGGG